MNALLLKPCLILPPLLRPSPDPWAETVLPSLRRYADTSFFRKPAVLANLLTIVSIDATVPFPVSALTRTVTLKNALNATDVIFIALVIPKSTALLYPSLLMSVIAAVSDVAVLWKNISIPPRLLRKNTNLSGPNPAPAFPFRKQKLFSWIVLSPRSYAKDSPFITSVSAILPKSCFLKRLFTTMSIPVSFLPEILISHVRSFTNPGDPDMIPLKLIKPAGSDVLIRTFLLLEMAGWTAPLCRLIPLKDAGVGKSFLPYTS